MKVNPSTGDITIIKTKVNLNDYIQYKKKQNYLSYCDHFYIATDKKNIYFKVLSDDALSDAGIIYVENDKAKVRKESQRNIKNDKLNRDYIIYKIYDKLWKKVYKL